MPILNETMSSSTARCVGVVVAGLIASLGGSVTYAQQPAPRPPVLSSQYAESAAKLDSKTDGKGGKPGAQGAAAGVAPEAATPQVQLQTGAASTAVRAASVGTVNPLTGNSLATEVKRQRLSELTLDVEIAQKERTLRELKTGAPGPQAVATPNAGTSSTVRTPARINKRVATPPAAAVQRSVVPVATPPVVAAAAPRLVGISSASAGHAAIFEYPNGRVVAVPAGGGLGDTKVEKVDRTSAVINGQRVELDVHGIVTAPARSAGGPAGLPAPGSGIEPRASAEQSSAARLPAPANFSPPVGLPISSVLQNNK